MNEMRTKRWLVGVGLVVVLVLAMLSIRTATRSKGEAALEKVKTTSSANPGLSISKEAQEKNLIATSKVVRVKLAADLQIVGSVTLDQNHYAVVGPLISGRVVKLRAAQGDLVKTGQVLAEIESAEVGQAQAAYLSARARAGSADANIRRERDLAAKHISSDREREIAEAQATSETAELRAATERLRALGLVEAEVDARKGAVGTGGRVALRSPIDGTVVSRTVTLGQAVERATDAFKIVNLTHLWVMLDLYEKDLRRVHIGQKVELRTEAAPGEVFQAQVAYVNPLIDEQTRTASVRVEFDNGKSELRPGQFVTAKLVGDPSHESMEALAVSHRAVQAVDGKRVVFVRGSRGFERRYVELGVSGGELVELQSGVTEGEEVVTDGAFLLKSELLR